MVHRVFLAKLPTIFHFDQLKSILRIVDLTSNSNYFYVTKEYYSYVGTYFSFRS